MKRSGSEVVEVGDLIKDILVFIFSSVSFLLTILFFEEGIRMEVLSDVALRLDITNIQKRVEQVLVAVFLHFQIQNVLLFDKIVHGLTQTIF